jgi:uncharacterized membrane protein
MKPKMEFYNWITEHAKPLLLMAFTAFCSVFTPIEDAMYILFVAFIFNVITGIAEDKIIKKNDFSIKKAFEAITQLFFYYALIFLIHTAGCRLKDPEVATTGVKWITYIVVYFYATNAIRNAKSIYPGSKTIAFMYDVLSTAIFLRLKNMIGINNEKSKEE